MSDHEYWMGGEDKTAQWPTPAPNGQGSSEAESTDPLGVASTQEGAPTWPLPAGATASSAGPADAGAPQLPETEPNAAGPQATGAAAGEPALGQPPFEQPPTDQPPAPQAPYGQAPYGQPAYGQAPHGQAPYGQPAYGQAPYGQPPYGQPPYGQPPYGQPPYGQPPYGQPPYGQPPYGPEQPHGGPQKPSRRSRGLRSAAAVLVIAAAALAGAGVSRVVSSSGQPVAVGPTTPATGGSGNSGSSGGTFPFGGSSGGNSGSGNSGSFPFPFGNEGGTGSGNSGSGSSGSGSSEGAGGPSDVSAIAAKVAPDIVDVNVTFNYQDAEGAGTGIVLTSDGLVLTNNHVIDEATKVSVTDVGNGKTYPATVLGYDKTHDVALLQLQGASNLQTAKLASSGASVGQAVVAIGNAGGTGGTPTSAGGSVTALGQSITANDALSGGSEQLSGLIETNANIEAGDSGGPLVNVSGQVVGMDTAASDNFAFSAEGNQGFAIPISEAWTIAKNIEAGHTTSTIHIGGTAFIGLQISSNSNSSGGFGFSPGSGAGSGAGSVPGSASGPTPANVSGIDVGSVVGGTPAQKVGIAAGDVVTAFDGHSLTTDQQLTNLLVPLHPGDTATITWVTPDGASHTGTITLASGPAA
jgi:S1-C subfamily serine protease